MQPQRLQQRRQGFTLIELMVTLTIAALLVLAVIPSFGLWVANAKVRSVAEDVQNGLRQAQAEAIRRNRVTVFALTSATPALGATPVANGKNWYVQTLPLTSGATSETAVATDFVQGGNYATQAGVSITGPAVLCFGSLGAVAALGASAAINVLGTACAGTANTYTLAKTQADRTLKVVVSVGGQVRMCDPQKTLSSSQPDGC
jgi:type IV fimbrial biogenesis protein FimT